MNNRLEERQTSGITLIALVVTIVVLVILATVSLNAVLGEKGLINTTQKGRVEQSHQLVWESMGIEYSTYYAEKIEQKGVMTENFVEYLQGKQLISNDMVDEGYVINVEKLVGGKSSLGNGTDGRNDVYKLEKVNSATAKTTKLASTSTKIKMADEDSDEDKYRVKYYGESGERELGVLTDGIKNAEDDTSPYIIIEEKIVLTEELLEGYVNVIARNLAYEYWQSQVAEQTDDSSDFFAWYDNEDNEYKQLKSNKNIEKWLQVVDDYLKRDGKSFAKLLNSTCQFYVCWLDEEDNLLEKEVKEIRFEPKEISIPSEETLTVKVKVPDNAKRVCVAQDSYWALMFDESYVDELPYGETWYARGKDSGYPEDSGFKENWWDDEVIDVQRTRI